jgi:hypothetical protein
MVSLRRRLRKAFEEAVGGKVATLTEEVKNIVDQR